MLDNLDRIARVRHAAVHGIVAAEFAARAHVGSTLVVARAIVALCVAVPVALHLGRAAGRAAAVAVAQIVAVVGARRDVARAVAVAVALEADLAAGGAQRALDREGLVGGVARHARVLVVAAVVATPAVTERALFQSRLVAAAADIVEPDGARARAKVAARVRRAAVVAELRADDHRVGVAPRVVAHGAPSARVLNLHAARVHVGTVHQPHRIERRARPQLPAGGAGGVLLSAVAAVVSAAVDGGQNRVGLRGAAERRPLRGPRAESQAAAAAARGFRKAQRGVYAAGATASSGATASADGSGGGAGVFAVREGRRLLAQSVGASTPLLQAAAVVLRRLVDGDLVLVASGEEAAGVAVVDFDPRAAPLAQPDADGLEGLAVGAIHADAQRGAAAAGASDGVDWARRDEGRSGQRLPRRHGGARVVDVGGVAGRVGDEALQAVAAGVLDPEARLAVERGAVGRVRAVDLRHQQLPGRPDARVAALSLGAAVVSVAAVAPLHRVGLVVVWRVREVVGAVVEERLVRVAVREGEAVAAAARVLPKRPRRVRIVVGHAADLVRLALLDVEEELVLEAVGLAAAVGALELVPAGRVRARHDARGATPEADRVLLVGEGRVVRERLVRRRVRGIRGDGRAAALKRRPELRVPGRGVDDDEGVHVGLPSSLELDPDRHDHCVDPRREQREH